MAEGFTFPVEAGKVREFAKAVLDDDNPIYWDAAYARARGFKAPLVPPTFVQASSFWPPSAQQERSAICCGCCTASRNMSTCIPSMSAMC